MDFRKKIDLEQDLNKNETPDASSKFQNLLPISSDKFIKTLDDWGIEYKYFEHIPFEWNLLRLGIYQLFWFCPAFQGNPSSILECRC